MDHMDPFERELARMMREAEEATPFEDRYRRRLRAGIRARRAARTTWMATGSALTVVGLCVGLVFLPGALAQGEPTAPEHRRASATPVPTTGIEQAPWRKPTAPEPAPVETKETSTSSAK